MSLLLTLVTSDILDISVHRLAFRSWCLFAVDSFLRHDPCSLSVIPIWWRQFVFGVSVRAVGSLRAPSCDVVLADHFPSVLVSAIGSMFAESSCIPWAILDLALGVDMKVNTLCSIVALAVLAVEPALGHLAQVVLVQELAVVALLAETSKPMFANHSLGWIRPDMSELTVDSF